MYTKYEEPGTIENCTSSHKLKVIYQAWLRGQTGDNGFSIPHDDAIANQILEEQGIQKYIPGRKINVITKAWNRGHDNEVDRSWKV